MKLYLYTFALVLSTIACTNKHSFVIEQGSPATIVLSPNEGQVVHTAIDLIKRDYLAVFGDSLSLSPTLNESNSTPQIFVATYGTKDCDPLLQKLGIKSDILATHPESYHMGVQIVDEKPILYIIGGDDRGTAYGLMAMSELMGVSPWEWWADSPIKPRKRWIVDSFSTIEYPKVRYRGIFLNDEEWYSAFVHCGPAGIGA